MNTKLKNLLINFHGEFLKQTTKQKERNERKEKNGMEI